MCLELDARWQLALMASLVFPLMMGVAARQCLGGWHGDALRGLALSELSGSLQALQSAPQPAELALIERDEARDVAPALVAVAAVAERPAQPRDLTPERAAAPRAGDVVSAQQVLRVFTPLHGPAPAPAAETANTWLRVQALHLGEAVRVRPFDASGAADAQAFDALRHLMRCRVTGEEVEIDARLVRILVQIGATYDRPIQLVSGHRTPHVIGTSETSQHTLGRAADIKLAGVDIEQLRALALKLGARGVGLYPEKGFVHVDVRDKAKYTWTYTEAMGEEPDMH